METLKKVSSIKSYQANISVFFEDGTFEEIHFDGQAGEFSKRDWLENDLSHLDSESQEKICQILENSSNIPFFSEEV